MFHYKSYIIVVHILICIQNIQCAFLQKQQNLLVGSTECIPYIPETEILDDENLTISFHVEDQSIIKISTESIKINSLDTIFFNVTGLQAGKSDVIVTIKTNSEESLKTTQIVKPGGFIIINVHKSDIIVTISEVIGWMYFTAWSISFYPQAWTNFKRKSVVGLNFDYVSFNFVGFLCYSVFNIGLYGISLIREQYNQKYPTSVIPILIHDVVFAVHGLLLTITYCIQCAIYEGRAQRISLIGKGFHLVFAAVIFISLILVQIGYMSWLDFMYTCSYIKLSITITKYFPQVYMNYQRKSTVGWNIYNILWDLAGGILSIFQMGLNGYNYDEWEGLVENPTKFWLGVLTIVFDVVFILQHYGLYRNREYGAAETDDILDERYFVSKSSIYSRTTIQPS